MIIKVQFLALSNTVAANARVVATELKHTHTVVFEPD